MSIKKNKDKSTITIVIYFTLRLLVIASLIIQGFNGNWNNVFLCIIILILFTVPDFISKKWNIKLPNTLEIIAYIFIFSAAFLGEIQNFYGTVPYWDTILHTLNGFLCGAVGFSLVDILNKNKEFHIKMTPAFMALVAFCFSMTIAVVWEFLEFGADYYLGKDMQKDRIVTKISSFKLDKNKNEELVKIDDIKKTIIYSNDKIITINNGYLEIGLFDTIKDLFVNFIGALVFSLIGYLYIKNKGSYKFAEIFIPKLNYKNE